LQDKDGMLQKVIRVLSICICI